MDHTCKIFTMTFKAMYSNRKKQQHRKRARNRISSIIWPHEVPK